MPSKSKNGRAEISLDAAAASAAPKPSGAIIAIGCSDDGFDQLRTFFSRIEPRTDLRCLILPTRGTKTAQVLIETLARLTPMPVEKAQDGAPIEGGRIYVIPPGAAATVEEGFIRIRNSPPGISTVLPMDRLFRSLAKDQKENAIAVLLAGGGSDGTLGLKAIKEEGGFTLAHREPGHLSEAMPTSAALSGVVDCLIPAEEMWPRIVEFIRHTPRDVRSTSATLQSGVSQQLATICLLLQRRTGHDFSRYKQTTLVRRIQRRIRLARLSTPEDYVDLLRHDSTELDHLFADLLIGVTQFFRDPDAFDALSRYVISPLLKLRRPDTAIRVWVPGCASGEEAYSHAMLLLERLGSSNAQVVQIFGTDIDSQALEVARKGFFPLSIAEQLSPDRLARFFIRRRTGYEVKEELRKACVFSTHNLIADPPFSRLDLISCRNVLIYLEATLQERLLQTFHFALNPSGFLFLGPSENAAGRSELFRSIEKKHRIFQRKAALLTYSAHVPIPRPPERPKSSPGPSLAVLPNSRQQSFARSIERILLEEYAPAGAVINEQGEVVYFCGTIGRFLEPAAGAATGRITTLVNRSLRLELRSAISKATAARCEVLRPGLAVRNGNSANFINLIVRPLPELNSEQGLYLVVFQDVAEWTRARVQSIQASPESDLPLLQELENELRTTREDLQSTIEELETSNEELKSANEELLSMNEEQQSTNEELQTSKEELHSVNEELQEKIEELDRAHSDLQNFYHCADVATVFLDQDLRVRKFTPALNQIGPVFERDIGRHLLELLPELKRHGLEHDFKRVLATDLVQERQIGLSGESRWFTVRVLPYHNLQKAPEGLVITFTDVTQIKHFERELQRSHRQIVSTLDRITDAFSAFDSDWRFVYVNRKSRALMNQLNKDPEQILGKVLWEIFPDLLGTPAETNFRQAMAEQVPLIFEQFYPPLQSWFEMRVYPSEEGISVYSQDITARKQVEQALRRSEARFRAIFDQATSGVAQCDTQGRFVLVNDEFCRLLGRSREELLGLTVRDLTHPDDWEENNQLFSCLIQEGRPFTVEKRYLRPNGEVIWVHVSVGLIRDLDGMPEYAVAVVTDLTTRKLFESQLRERMRLAALRADLGAALSGHQDFPDTLQRCCQAMVTHLDMAFARIWLSDKSGTELQLKASAGLYTHLDGAHSRIKVGEFKIGRIAQRKEPHLTNRVVGDPQISNPEWAKREGMVAFAGYPMIIEGELQGVVAGFSTHLLSETVLSELGEIANGIAQWIRRKRAEEELRESEQRFRCLSACSQVGIFLTDTCGNCTYTNPRCQAIGGFTFEEALGTGWTTFLHPDDRTRVCKLWSEAVRDGQPFNHEFRFCGKDGQVRFVQVSSSALLSDQKHRIGFVGTIEDITERRRYEEHLQAAQDQLSRYAEVLEKQVAERTASLNETVGSLERVCYTMAHDLRGPLRALHGFTKLLVDERQPLFDDEAREYARRIVSAATRMDSLISDLLQYAKIAHGAIPIVPLNLKSELDQVLEQLAPVIHARKATVRLAEPLPRVMGNPVLLKQVLTNLIGNALKFVSQEVCPRVEVWAEQHERRMIRLFLRDNGIGIDPEHHERIFDLFQRLHSDDRYPGTGIGLAIVRKAMERMAGSAGLKSSSGQGSCFQIDLPSAESES